MENDEFRKILFEANIREAEGLYKLIITVSSSFLGGSLFFYEKITPNPKALSLISLFAGWGCLVASLLFVVLTRRYNIRSLRDFSRQGDAQDSVSKAEKTTFWAVICLAVGIAFIMLFGAINIVCT